MSVYEGSCHCGAVRFSFRTEIAPNQWRVRACQCGFCRAHGARTTTDPKGAVEFSFSETANVQRYRFGSGSSDFLICGECGVYVAAVLASDRGRFTTINVNTLTPPLALPAAEPVSYDGERPEQRRMRREERWTPVVGAA